MTFQPDPAFEASSLFAADSGLCHIRLQDDARFPWLILIPRRPNVVELEDLSETDRTALTEDIIRAGRIVRAMGEAFGHPIDKLNVAALSNVTPQLHVHVVGRRRDDPLWPDPVWGRGEQQSWSQNQKATLLALINDFPGLTFRSCVDPCGGAD